MNSVEVIDQSSLVIFESNMLLSLKIALVSFFPAVSDHGIAAVEAVQLGKLKHRTIAKTKKYSMSPGKILAMAASLTAAAASKNIAPEANQDKAAVMGAFGVGAVLIVFFFIAELLQGPGDSETQLQKQGDSETQLQNQGVSETQLQGDSETQLLNQGDSEKIERAKKLWRELAKKREEEREKGVHWLPTDSELPELPPDIWMHDDKIIEEQLGKEVTRMLWRKPETEQLASVPEDSEVLVNSYLCCSFES